MKVRRVYYKGGSIHVLGINQVYEEKNVMCILITGEFTRSVKYYDSFDEAYLKSKEILDKKE